MLHCYTTEVQKEDLQIKLWWFIWDEFLEDMMKGWSHNASLIWEMTLFAYIWSLRLIIRV